MGNTIGVYNRIMHPDVTPEADVEPKFDPNFGFKEPRKPKVMVATELEMESAMLEDEFRDYCAHLYIDFLACKAKHIPWIRNCTHQYHAYNWCLYDETIDTYKDYERERRLMVRAKRINEKKEREERKRQKELLQD